ncbi:MAG: transposase [Bacteroidetes bacterium]|nr:transposase [Bacteroidota bacterium]
MKKQHYDSRGYEKKTYRSSETVCKDCPLMQQCNGGTTRFKKLDDCIHKPFYDRMHRKLSENKAYHRRLVKRRSATVEPVLGTLINHMSLRRVNTRGMSGANKHTLMAALCYNLKKHLKFIPRKVQTASQVLTKPAGESRSNAIDLILQVTGAAMRPYTFHFLLER